MILKKGKKEYILLLLFPLIFSTICYFTIFTGEVANYYESVDTIIQNSFPDFVIKKESDSFLYTEQFQKQTIMELFPLDEYTHIGILKTSTIVNNNKSLKLTVISAEQEIYQKYYNFTLNNGEVFLDSSLRNLIPSSNELNFSFINKSKGSVNITLSIKGYAFLNSIFPKEFLSIIDYRTYPLNNMDNKYILITDKTFDTIFRGKIENFQFTDYFLFKFSRRILYSQKVDEMLKYINSIESEIKFHFQVVGKKNDFYYTLKWKLEYNKELYLVVELLQLGLLFILASLITFLFISITSESYINKQREKYALFRLRGGKRYELFKEIILISMKNFFYTYFVVSILALSYVMIFYSSLLHYRWIFGSFALTLFGFEFCIINLQILFLIRYLKVEQNKQFIYENNNYEYFLRKLGRMISVVFKELVLPLIPTLTIGIIFYYYIFEFMFGIELYVNYWILGLFYLFFITISFFISKKRIYWIGTQTINVLNKIEGVITYSKKATRKIIVKNQKMLKLLTIFILILSSYLSIIDSYNRYQLKNKEFNDLGDLTIVYPALNNEMVQHSLKNFVSNSVEISYREATSIVKSDLGTYVRHIKIDIFAINNSKIMEFVKINKFSENYEGSKDVNKSLTEIYENTNKIIISQDIASKIEKEIGDTFAFYTYDDFTGDDWTKKEIVDVVDTIPLFSWLSFYYFQGDDSTYYPRFMLVNDKAFNQQNFFEDTVSILTLKETLDKSTVIKEIMRINQEQHLDIQILDYSTHLIPRDYSYLLTRFSQTIAYLILFSLVVLILIVSYTIEISQKQLRYFSVFFARGVSIKKGIFISLMPLLLFFYYLILIGNSLGWFFTYLFTLELQPFNYLKVNLALFPYSFVSFSLQLLIISFITCIVGLINYLKLRKSIPVINDTIGKELDLERLN